MHSNFFFNVSWVGQLVVGFGLFLCSLFIEYQVFIHFISPPSLAVLICVTLEGGKVAAVIWHYYLGCLGTDAYPFSIRISSLVFRFGLVLLSILCSMLFFTSRLDRPNLDQVRQERLQKLTSQKSDAIETMRRQQEQEVAVLDRLQVREMKQMETHIGGRIDRLDALLVKEMDNVVGGVFKGRRYLELEQRLAQEKKGAGHDLNVLQTRHALGQQHLREEQSALMASFNIEFTGQRQQILNADFTDDEQANDEHIIALLKTIKTMFGLEVRPLQFVFFFSILISLLMETGIMLSFATITTIIAPVLHEHHIEELQMESVRLRSGSAQAREESRHQASMARVRRATENISQEAAALGESL